MNKIFLSGRITKEPEMRKTQSGIDVLNFDLAVNRPGAKKDENMPPDFFPCTVWGGKEGPGRAGVIQKFFHKGDGITVIGQMQSRKYQDKDSGKNVIAWSVVVEDFEFPLSRRQDGQQTTQAPAQQPADRGFVEVDSSEPLPF